jgi:asparagine synthase (glutamine-hydrolysing)
MVLSQEASKNVKVVLDGEGSDELFGGYSWYRMDKMLRPLTKLPWSIRQILARTPGLKRKWPRATRLFATPGRRMDLERYKKFIDHTNMDFNDHIFSDDLRLNMMSRNLSEELSLPHDFERWEPFAQLQYLEMKVRLSDYITRNLDATSMAYSLEVRVPFLDHELIEFCGRMPAALKMRRFEEKHILRQAMKNLLPLEIVRRKKRGLAAPYAEWVKQLPEFARDLLSEATIREKGYFNPAVVQAMLQQHRNGQANFSPQLMGILGIHLWDEKLMHGCQPIAEQTLDSV